MFHFQGPRIPPACERVVERTKGKALVVFEMEPLRRAVQVLIEELGRIIGTEKRGEQSGQVKEGQNHHAGYRKLMPEEPEYY
jgi:hypothetical protein